MSRTIEEEEYGPPTPPRPIPPQQTRLDQYIGDRGPEVVASSLAPQLGSDSATLSKGQVDMRRFSVIEERDLPFLIYAKIRGRKTRVWNDIYDMVLNLKVSIGGRGRRDIIRMEGVSKGGLPEEAGEIQKPGWFQRNITDREWRKRAEKDGL